MLVSFLDAFRGSTSKIITREIRKIKHSENLTMSLPTIYRSVESVLNVLNTHKNENLQAVEALLQVYNNALKVAEEKNQDYPSKSHPLIILEGLDGCGKSRISRELSAKLSAAKWGTPPDSIKHIRELFDDHPTLRTAYYALGNYIAALECTALLKQKPVVMDRYWHSTAAYAVAQAVHDWAGKIEMPPEGDSFYKWPEDLLKPSIVIFLDVVENVRLERLSRRKSSTTQEDLLKSSKQFRDNIILAYKNMVDPEVVFVDCTSPVKVVLSQIDKNIKHLF
ncbi:UMP-CMP kinase 2, mitochondrial-like [Tribolium madens]|uniref:UMP-CMP kinase 2, mitochondrial-like n=1 Tax=Tribolium madens TaxID=41895 RepID=UPI001CF73215|nr:UMP-CMP kinase 2, mitochondrial-like [Tribolium madens]